MNQYDSALYRSELEDIALESRESVIFGRDIINLSKFFFFTKFSNFKIIISDESDYIDMEDEYVQQFLFVNCEFIFFTDIYTEEYIVNQNIEGVLSLIFIDRYFSNINDILEENENLLPDRLKKAAKLYSFGVHGESTIPYLPKKIIIYPENVNININGGGFLFDGSRIRYNTKSTEIILKNENIYIDSGQRYTIIKDY